MKNKMPNKNTRKKPPLTPITPIGSKKNRKAMIKTHCCTQNIFKVQTILVGIRSYTYSGSVLKGYRGLVSMPKHIRDLKEDF